MLNFTNNIVVSGIWSDSSQSSVYRLGGVNYTNGAISTQELERVTRSELYHLLGSNLTKPTVTYPIYIYEDQKLFVYPTSITSGITCDFVKKPVNPSWNFTSTASSNYAYIYDSTTSINFELHQSEQTEMILKVLLYAGVVIKDPQIIQAAAAQIQAEDKVAQETEISVGQKGAIGVGEVAQKRALAAADYENDDWEVRVDHCCSLR